MRAGLVVLHYLVAILTIIFIQAPLAYAAVDRMPPQVKFERVAVSQIESIDYINSIAQDADGYIWIGAIKGLMRYDGYELKKFVAEPGKANSLSSSWINSIVKINDDQLWIVTLNGLCEYRPTHEDFDCIAHPDEEKNTSPMYSSMFQDSRGNIWVSLSTGLKQLNLATRELIDPPSSLSQAIPPLANSDAHLIHEITEDLQGNLWFGLQGNGLIRYSPETDNLRWFNEGSEGKNALSGNKVRALLVDSRGVLWVGTFGGGLSYFNTETDRFNVLNHSDSEKSKEVWDVLEDSNGLLWIGDGDGVHLLDPINSRIEQYRYEEGSVNGPGNFVVRDLFMDSANGIWLGYFPSGIDKVDNQASQFNNYRHKPQNSNSLADGGVLSTLEDKQGNLWIGCGFGLSYLNRKTETFERFVHDKSNPDSLSGSTILDIEEEADGTLWVGAWDRGLNKRDPSSGKFKRYIYEPTKTNSLFGREPWALEIDNKGVLWVGTELGFNRYRKQSDDFEQFFPVGENGEQLKSLYIRKLFQDSRETLWIGSFNGLYAFDTQTKTFTKHYLNDPDDDTSLSSNEVLSIYEDQSGDIWVGTSGGGLNLMDRQSGKFKRYGLEQGLPDMSISGIVDDEHGDIWVSTFRGLARLDKATQKFTVFEKRDGLLGNQYNRNSPSRLSTGELVFGSTRGLTIFDPASLKVSNHLPPVVFTRFSIFNEPIAPGKNSVLEYAIGRTKAITLNHSQSVFSFEYAGLDFISPEENQYAYRLARFEKNWNYVGNRRSATYTNLDPGQYVFEVKAANSNGLWNPVPAQIAITILPPYWRTPLAYFVYVVLVAAIIARAWYVQRAKLSYERKKYEQEREVVMRLKELDQMKDEINKELDKKVAERTEALNQEHNRLLEAQKELQALNKKLEEVSLTDSLTGLKNRRFLNQSIEDDLAIVHRNYCDAIESGVLNKSEFNDVSFIVLDVDKFKSVNDEYGHSAGDKVLVQLSAVIKKELRQSDYLIRWGGEEFVVVVRHLPRSFLPAIAQRIRDAVKRHPFELDEKVSLQKTCSIGYAAFPFIPTKPDAISWEQVVNIADRALYCAKASGRDSWVGIEFNADFSFDETELHRVLAAINTPNIKSEIARSSLIIRSSNPLEQLIWN